jgi:hypothetical protein
VIAFNGDERVIEKASESFRIADSFILYQFGWRGSPSFASVRERQFSPVNAW